MRNPVLRAEIREMRAKPAGDGRPKTERSGRVDRDNSHNMLLRWKFSANCFIRDLDESPIIGFNSFIPLWSSGTTQRRLVAVQLLLRPGAPLPRPPLLPLLPPSFPPNADNAAVTESLH